jgi:hypothetical protein
LSPGFESYSRHISFKVEAELNKFVSSDDNEEMQIKYMKEAHGDWLYIPFDSPIRNELKIKYGVCAAKEKESVGVEPRHNGIPTLLGKSALLFPSAQCF